MLVPLLGFGQDFTYKVRRLTVDEHWTPDPRKFDDEFFVSVQNLEAPYPGGEVSRNTIAELKKHVAVKYPKVDIQGSSSARGGRSADSLTQIENFPARFFFNDNPLVGGRPNDNTLAISNDGKLLTSWNSQVWGYDTEQDTFLFRDNSKHPSFNQFLNFYADTTFSLYFPFDPKLIYDPNRDRFILVFLTGRDPGNSGAIVCFSSSNNPVDEWYAYWLSGDPLQDSTWTDYPQMAINENNLYLTLNQLYPDSSWITGFAQTVIWQMDLDAGFAGEEELPVSLWNGMEYGGQKLRYLRPVKTGWGPESDTMYFVCNRPFDLTNDSLFLIRITGDVDDPNAAIDVKLALADQAYGLPPDAEQPNNHVFLTNDARALGAVRMGDQIHFVGNTVEPNSGKAAIYHGIIDDPNNPSVRANIITHPVREYGYPNISALGVTEADREVAIFFNHTAADAPAGNSIVYFDNNEEYGPVQTLKEGESYVDRISGPTERWGDYIGIQRKFNETSKVWVAGYWSFSNNSNGTWISELSGPKDGPIGTGDPDPMSAIRAYPNPASDFINFQFEMEEAAVVRIEILNIEGKVVKILAQDKVKSGLNRLTFGTTALIPGAYIVQIVGDSGIVLKEQFIKQ
jgi:hypothetical protein